MTYNPTKTAFRSLETDEMEVRPALIEQNFSLIALETKKLEERILVNAGKIDENAKKMDEEQIIFANHLLFL